MVDFCQSGKPVIYFGNKREGPKRTFLNAFGAAGVRSSRVKDNFMQLREVVKSKRSAGFTLIEILLVIVIILLRVL